MISLKRRVPRKGIKKNEIADVLSDICQKADDVQKIFGKNLKNVVRTFPGVELVHLPFQCTILRASL